MAEINLQKRVVYAGDVHIALLKSGWSIREACDFVNGLPKADVAEVRRGFWENRPINGAYDACCSVCGFAPGIKFYKLPRVCKKIRSVYEG